MTVPRERLDVDELSGVVQAAFGGARELRRVERLTGGTKKGVYRLTLDDGTTSIAYLWNDEEDYWAGHATADATDPFGHATGLDLFETAHRELSEVGVRVPRLVFLDRSTSLIHGDVAVLEDLPGGTLEALLDTDPAQAARVLAQLSDDVQTMHALRRDRYGRPDASSASGRQEPLEQLVLDRALGHLAEAAVRVERIAAVEQRLAEALRERRHRVTPRTDYGLIHGELGPDHVFLDAAGAPVLIDIEGVMFLDVEWEHVWLELRFGDHYRRLAAPGLDQDRLRLYRLAQYLSLVEGPLRLLDGDFPDRASMLAIVESNIARTLAELR